jgi:hypothetical protein
MTGASPIRGGPPTTGTASVAMRAGATRLGALLAALALLVPAQASAQNLIGDEVPAVELDPSVPLPAAPGAQAGIEFPVSVLTSNRFAIDPDALILQQGRLVRFTLIVTSSSGVRNVSHEAIRCAQAQRRLLAIGLADGTWSPVRSSTWQPVNVGATVNRAHAELMARWCSGGQLTGRDAKALLRLLEEERRPGH